MISFEVLRAYQRACMIQHDFRSEIIIFSVDEQNTNYLQFYTTCMTVHVITYIHVQTNGEKYVRMEENFELFW